MEIDLLGPSAGAVVLDVADTETVGLEVALVDRVFDFEADDGGFARDGATSVWEWGEPTIGPGFAASGRKVWATDFEDDYPGWTDFWLASPEFTVPASVTESHT